MNKMSLPLFEIRYFFYNCLYFTLEIKSIYIELNLIQSTLCSEVTYNPGRLILEGLTSLNVSIIKFYDIYLLKYIHGNRSCKAFHCM